MKDNERPLFIEKIEKDDTGTTVKYRYLGFLKEYRIPFIDDAYIENSLNAFALELPNGWLIWNQLPCVWK